MKSVVLLSGGVDSATVAAMARGQGLTLSALTIAYGQRHEVETKAAHRVAEAIGVADHVVLPIDLRAFGGSALTDHMDVPKGRSAAQMQQGIPITYVPARNTILLALALGYAEAIGAGAVFIGVNAVDFSGYPDCRPEFVEAFQRLAEVGTKAGAEGRPIRIHAPLIRMSKAQIIREGLRLGVDYSLTHSCYDPAPDGAACGECDSCLLRLQGFREAGVQDVIRYAR
jgi:7-cyano-7-deazaguanine synthase